MTWYLISATDCLTLRPGGEYSVGSALWCDAVVTEATGVEDRHLIVRISSDGLSWHVMDTSSSGSATAHGKFQSRIGTDALSLQLGSAGGPYVALSTSPSFKLSSAPRAVWPRTNSSTSGNRIRYGRARDNDVVLDSPLASLYHAVVTISAGTWTLTDEGSARGTLVNGERTSRRVLAPGDWVTMGGQPFRVDGDGALVPVRLRNGVPLKIRGLTVKAGSETLLNSIDLDVPPKSLVAVVGPSGSGKSTFLRSLSGLRPADSGTVLIDGEDLYQGYAEWRFRIGVVPQDDLVPPQLTVGQAMDYAARLRFPSDTGEAERSTRIDAVLDELKLSERRHLRIDRLSGGQRKRVNVALELLTRPPLLFLDEPTSGLDPGLDQQLMMMLKELVQEGRTVVVVTHSMDNLGLCDRVLVLATGGHVAYWGPPKEAFSYFQVTDWPGVFLALDSRKGKEWTETYRAWLKARRAEQHAKAGPTKETPKRLRRAPLRGGAASSAWRQWATLTSRTWRVTVTDRATLGLIVALPLVLAVLGILVGSPFGLGPGDNPYPLNPDARILLLVLILGAAFMGAATSIQALVQERVIYHRERTVGLSRPAYVLSKAVVLGGIALVQGTVFAGLSLVGRSGPLNWYLTGWGTGDIILIIAMLSFCSCMLGLLLSTLLPNLDASLPVLVIATMVQVVLSGAIPLRWGAIDDVLGPLIPASWAFGALASLTDLSALLGPAANETWDATIGPVGAGLVAMAVMSAAFVLLAIWRQGSADPGRASR